MPKREPLVIAYDRTTCLDTGAMAVNRRLAMKRIAEEAGLEVTEFVTDEKPANFSEQRELHKLLDFAREKPQELVLVASTPYRLVKAGLKVMVPVLSELCELVAMLLFADNRELGGCQAIRWTAEVQSAIATERAALARVRGVGVAGRPKLAVDVIELRRLTKRGRSVRKAAMMLGIDPQTARRRLREIEAITKS